MYDILQAGGDSYRGRGDDSVNGIYNAIILNLQVVIFTMRGTSCGGDGGIEARAGEAGGNLIAFEKILKVP